MKARVLISALAAVSPQILLLALTRPREARYLVSVTLRGLDEFRGRGLPSQSALRELLNRNSLSYSTLVLPVPPWDNGGTAVQELCVLAGVAALMKPARVFEIGTFSGLATCAFVMNSPPLARVFTLDLPPRDLNVSGYLPSDAELVRERQVGELYIERGFQDRVTQLFADSRTFDTTPYLDSIDLGFIDGAHTAEYVENDTRKMVAMMRPDGMILWHDYGGRGSFSGVTDYLEDLATRAPVYREPNTTLAWAMAGSLKSAVR